MGRVLLQLGLLGSYFIFGNCWLVLKRSMQLLPNFTSDCTEHPSRTNSFPAFKKYKKYSCESARPQYSTFCDHWKGNWVALLKSVGTLKCCWSPVAWSHLKTHRHYSSCCCLAWVDINMFWWQKDRTGDSAMTLLAITTNLHACHISDK